MPLAGIGSTSSLSTAHWVGFVNLIGIVGHGGILMPSHFRHLIRL